MTGTPITLYDTTLRDGTQGEGITFSADDKLRIAQKLDGLGIHYIEGGWPGSNPKDVEFFTKARDLHLDQAIVSAFGSTRRAGIRPADDSQMITLLEAGTATCTIFGKSWDLHVREVLQTTLAENLAMVGDSVAYLRNQGREVIYDAEHFFDGYKAHPDYALSTLEAAAQAGAATLVLCDTNGGTLPWELDETVRRVVARFPHLPIGIHTHNDSEAGVVNSLTAVRAGCVHVQGTINGYGERCGNANLVSIIPNLQLKMGYPCMTATQLASLREVANFVSEMANLSLDIHTPFVGHSAFAHKGGTHVNAIVKCEQSYQHIDPTLVGNKRRVVVSELAGKSNISVKVEEYGLNGHMDAGQAKFVLSRIKEMESQGYQFEGAEASVELMMRRLHPNYQAPFELIDFTTQVEHRQGRGMLAEATVKVKVGSQIFHTVGEGNGPVNALDGALRKALLPIYPRLADVQLTDYKVRILDGFAGTAATTRVLIDSTDGQRHWSTVGCSGNIIEASWLALADSVEYGLLNDDRRP